MVNKVSILLLFFAWMLSSSSLVAQHVPVDIFARLETHKPGSGQGEINQSAEITSMINLHISQMRKMNGIKGYRVCIYYNSGQEANKGADQERARFIGHYEDVKCYKSFESPFFKVYAGDFRTKSEALKFLERIKFDYPNAFIRENITVAFPE
jgi:hypothetical protein